MLQTIALVTASIVVAAIALNILRELLLLALESERASREVSLIFEKIMDMQKTLLLPAHAAEGVLIKISLIILAPLRRAVLTHITATLVTARKLTGRHENRELIRARVLEMTVAGLLANSRAADTVRSHIVLVTALLLHLLLALTGLTQFYSLLTIAISALLLLLHINQMLLAFRIRHGIFGDNDYEAREILSFILSRADKQDFSDDDGLKDVFPRPEQIRWQLEFGGDLKGVQT